MFYTLMPSTEEVVKSSQQPEDFIMHVNWQLNQDFKNQSFWLKSQSQMMQLVVFITVWIQEEELLLKKNKLLVLHSQLSELISQSLNLSVSPLTWEVWLKDKPSHNVSSITGLLLTETHWKLDQKLTILFCPSERERVLKFNYQILPNI